MSLKVLQSPAPPKLKVSANTGMQGSSYNPQSAPNPVQTTQPATVIQPASPASNIQSAQSASVIQPAITNPEVINRIAEELKQRVLAEAQALKVQKAGQTTSFIKVKSEQYKANVAVVANNQKTRVSVNNVKYKAFPDESDEYNSFYDLEYQMAQSEYDQMLKEKNSGFGAPLLDKFSDYRKYKGRQKSESKLKEISDSVTFYDNSLKDYLSLQAQKKANIEKTKFKSQEDFDKAVAEYEKWQNDMILYFEKTRARLNARSDLFGLKSQAPLDSPVFKAIAGAVSIPEKLNGNPLFRYTLGEGDKNIPSLTTLPSRLVNTVGNLNTKDRNIYKYGGETANRVGSSDNAWQSTFNQRNFNIRPYVDKPFNRDDALKIINGKRLEVDGGFDSLQRKDLIEKYNKTKDPATRDKILTEVWSEYNRANRNLNSAQEFVADPLNFVGAVGKLAKIDKLTDAIKASKIGTKVVAGTEKITSNPVIKWLAEEHKTPDEKLIEVLDVAKNKQIKIQDEIFDQVNAINKKLVALGESKIDLSVYEDLKKLTDSESAILQRTVGGKLSLRDRLLLVGKNNIDTRDKIESIARSWTKFTEDMKFADNVIKSSYGKDKKLYSPNTKYIRAENGDDLSKYNFKMKKKSNKIQKSKDFYRGAVDRYFVSNLDNSFAVNTKANISKYTKRRDALLSYYNREMDASISEVTRAQKRVTSPINKIRKIVGTPTRIWKKSVLKYRPAWTVNNAIYNTQASALAGGTGAIAEQVKMLRPKYWRKAMNESRAIAGSNLSREFGGKLDKFNTAVEDWSRVASYRANLKKGMTSEQSLKRVNKYLFDYKIRNIERPLKAVMPFYGFQKNLAKAAFNMPFDRPIGAKIYNSVDKYQRYQFDRDFESVATELKSAGYTDEEIAQIKKDNEKYFKGKLKVGNKYINTPFNAFSDKGLSSAGINPYLATIKETINGTDQFNRPQNNTKFVDQLIKKFPQFDLFKKYYFDKPTSKSWIGKAGSEGYGLSKTKQGFDATKANYDRNLDPKVKLADDFSALLGKPRSMTFDKDALVKSKVLQKVTTEYFATNWKDMKFDEAEAKRKEIFDRFGITADDFYKGILSKYDSDFTKQVKKMKQDASNANKSLFEEYSKQPYGTRSTWAMKKLQELNDSGYFDNNPFLKSFDWLTSDVIQKKKNQVKYTYDGKYFKSAESMQRYKKHKFFEAYLAETDPAKKRQMMRDNPQWAKRTPKSEAEIRSAKFWDQYYKSDSETKKRLLAENSEFNTKKNWTTDQWTEFKNTRRAEQRAKLRSVSQYSKNIDKYVAVNMKDVSTINARKLAKKRQKKLKWLLPV